MIEQVAWNISSTDKYFTKHTEITTIYNQY